MENNKTFFSNFFVMSDPISTKNFRGRIIEDFEITTNIRRSGYKKILEVTHLEGGKEPGRLFWNSVSEPFCINDEVLKILKQNKITGWETIPTKVITKDKKVLENFFTITITGRTGFIDEMSRDIVFHKYPGGYFPHFRGIYFKPDTWDGSDIFMTKSKNDGGGSSRIYVTKKVVDVFKKNKITNVAFENLNEYEEDCSAYLILEKDKERLKNIKEKIQKAEKNFKK